MQYQKIISGTTIIEFHNSLWGEETIKVNGQEVSKAKSIMGAEHFFTVVENNEEARYVLVTKVDSQMQPLLDLFRNGIPIKHNLVINYGKPPQNEYKKKGILFLNKYKLEEAEAQFLKAMDIDSFDAELYLYLACIYSLRENSLKGYEYLLKAKQKNLCDLSVFETNDMLAFLRIQEAFEGFKSSGYNSYDVSLMPTISKGDSGKEVK